ncbi:hypothetical protein HLB44_14825 [Aquincola sp. S2]|uniref:Uncharacterized protein n=1 Tax=Pseudaquabacterium terrae TaxID=2732868 RepID=A0ABX2EI12_9BURK|nr:hypothetical protein [Aquabacterium terrae]NRF68264.1 hypothetical protein [Aquabacterium terrae]
MNRLTPHAFLVVLAGIGWACAFAAVGLGLFADVPDHAPIAIVFGAFGFVGGAASTALRIAFEHHLPIELAARLRGRGGEAADADGSAPATVSPAPSAFGA